MTTLTAFPNVKLVLVAALTGLARTGTVAPANLTPPFLRIRVYGGNGDQITDRPRFDIDALASTEQAADTLAEQVRQLLIGGPHVTASGVLDRVTVDVRPNSVPWGDNPAIFNTTAAYSGSLRR